jgi:GH25 family lysozyme M1 (1,4-beta-N-acetylmuramidase)
VNKKCNIKSSLDNISNVNIPAYPAKVSQWITRHFGSAFVGLLVYSMAGLGHAAPPTAINQRVQVNANSVKVRTAPPALTDTTARRNTGEQGTTIGGPTTAILGGTSYVWWNVNFDSGTDGWVAQDFIDRIITTTVPVAPVASSPGTGSAPGETVATNTPTLSWSKSSGATTYEVNLSKEPYGSANIVFSNTNTGDVSSVPVTSALANNTNYRWNLNAKNSAGSSLSSNTLYFRVQTTPVPTVPDAPIASSPGTGSAPGEIITTGSPTLSWSKSSGATTYEVNLSKEPYGSANIVFSNTNTGDVSSVPVFPALTNNTNYRWNLYAKNSAGSSLVSNTRYFRVQTSVPPIGINVLGVDISYFQSVSSWPSVKQAPKQFAWIRASFNLTKDTSFESHVTGAKAAGVVTGAYCFPCPDVSGAQMTADIFVQYASRAIGAGNLPPCLDVEEAANCFTIPAGTGTNATLSIWVRLWCQRVQQLTGVKPIIYCTSGTAGKLESDLSQYPLWLAKWDQSVISSPASLYPWTAWTFKQYQSGDIRPGLNGYNGVCAGIGACDLDAYFGSLGDFNTLISTGGTDPVVAASKATNPTPANSTGNQSLMPNLTWSSGLNTNLFRIYLGRTSNLGSSELVSTQGVQSAFFAPDTLEFGTNYFWRIDSSDTAGTYTTGDVWSFSTEAAPVIVASKATNPTPADGTGNQTRTPNLTWTAGLNTNLFRIYLGTTSNLLASNLVSTQGVQSAFFTPDTLNFGTNYFWRIDSSDAGGTYTTGDVWSFSTDTAPVVAASKATNPKPADGAAIQSRTPNLTWIAGLNTNLFKIYLGTTSNLFASNLVSTQGVQSAFFTPDTLNFGTNYFWRIDSFDAAGTYSTGDVWSFSTEAAPIIVASKATNSTPADGAGNQSRTPVLTWTAGSNTTGFKIYVGMNSNLGAAQLVSTQGGHTAFFTPDPLSYTTTYYWRVDATNASGVTIGDVWSFTTADASTTRIVSVNGSLNFGNVTVGSSNTATLSIRNSGNTTLTVSGVAYPAGFSGNWSNGTIAAGAFKDVIITFSPTTATNFGGSINVISDNTSGVGSIIASGAGVPSSSKDLVIKEIKIKSASVKQGEKINIDLTVGNLGNTEINKLYSIKFYLGSSTNQMTYLIGNYSLSDKVNPSDTLTYFDLLLDIPSSILKGQYFVNGIIDFDNVISEIDESNNAGNSLLRVTVVSELSPEVLVQQPVGTRLFDGKNKKNFGKISVGKTSIVKIFYIKNTGSVKIDKIVITMTGANRKDFKLDSSPKSALAPGASTTFKVRFKPSGKGNRNASLQIKVNDKNENSFDINLAGYGVNR